MSLLCFLFLFFFSNSVLFDCLILRKGVELGEVGKGFGGVWGGETMIKIYFREYFSIKKKIL